MLTAESFGLPSSLDVAPGPYSFAGSDCGLQMASFPSAGDVDLVELARP